MIQNLLSPLIVEEKGYPGGEKHRRLFHSTVKEFVKVNPDILSVGDGVAENVSIGPSLLAEACRLYPSQPRYSSLLEKVDGGWKLAGGDSPDNDAFLSYAAKYWYLHPEDVSPSTSLAQKISAFLRSSNFQTLLQVQHLYVDRQFGVFTLRGKPCTSKFFKRALPHGFVRMASRQPNMHFSQDYRVFLHEWSYLLSCGCCNNPSCSMAGFAGQIDRCIFGTLGTNNFMSSMRSRYAGFSLCNGDQDGIRAIKTCYEGYSASGRVVHVAQFKCRTAPNLYFICETWQLNGAQKPKLQQRQTLEVHEEVASRNLFVENKDTDVTGRSGSAKLVAFDYGARGLRIVRSGNETNRRFFRKRTELTALRLAPNSTPIQASHIWPMSPGNVLFADFENKTWFKRKLRPTTTYTRQVFSKCHFSPCGEYLHIAILEARRKPPKEKKSKGKDPSPKPDLIPLELSLFVTTHRLLSRKTTRAPPTQIYRTKIELGHFHTLPVSQLPFALTWTPSQLYFTVSRRELTVFKIKPFPPRDGEKSESPVLVPRESVFLPATATTREVRFFPSPSDSIISENESKCKDEAPMHVLISSQIRSSRVLLGEGPSTSSPDSAHDGEGGFQVEGTTWIPQSEAIRGVKGSVSMPVGLYIPSEKDFGGWIRSDDIVDVPADKGVGQLDSKVERFGVDEDCDLEPYII
ncbi:hypothetical protein BDW75DRAFT_237145 [Aspergillus navahoensis]